MAERCRRRIAFDTGQLKYNDRCTRSIAGNFAKGLSESEIECSIRQGSNYPLFRNRVQWMIKK